ncbi:MAG: 2-dehydropantoate 2-reductase [bacterium]|nr:2-dehydropantoate 2-reductase [bacterium]
MSENPEILLIGTGAVGSYYCGKLAQSGIPLSTVCRSDYAIVKEKGISVKSIKGDFSITPEQVISTTSDYSGKPDFLVVATKVLPEINIPALIRDAVYPNTSIVLLQNGINIETPIVEAFPTNEIISATPFICVCRTAPGEINHQDYGSLSIGTYPSGSSEKTKLLSRLFNNAGVPCQVESDIAAARWKKLMWNASLNTTSVVSGGLDTRTMMESEKIKRLAALAMKEVLTLAQKAGYSFPDEIIQETLTNTHNMAPFKTSMLVDFENNRPMEVEAILGNTVRIAEEFGIPVPRLETLYALLSSIDEKIRKKELI